MKECPKCKDTFEESLSPEVTLNEITTELLERQKTSGLCLDCQFEEMMAETEQTDPRLSKPKR